MLASRGHRTLRSNILGLVICNLQYAIQLSQQKRCDQTRYQELVDDLAPNSIPYLEEANQYFTVIQHRKQRIGDSIPPLVDLVLQGSNGEK